MRLVHLITKKPVVEFKGNKTIFHNKFLEKEMRLMGIPIPHGVRSLYQGKECIYLEDITFQKAFKEIYYLTTMDTAVFVWMQE